MVQADDVPEADAGAVTPSLVERLRSADPPASATTLMLQAADEIEALSADLTKVQAELDAMAAEIERLRSQGGAPVGPSRTEQVLEDARTAIKIYDGVLALKARVATEFARGVDAAVKIIDGKVADYTSEHGSLDPETGVMEFSRSGEEYVSTLEELAEEIRTSLATGAVQPPEGGTGWRDIASAPKDGTEVIGWRDDCGPILVRWTSAGDFLTDAEAEESGMTEEQLYEESWFYADFVQGGRLAPDEYPTHWMPLPSPPGQDDRTNDGSETDGGLNHG